MPRFPADDLYINVNEIADREGLIWDGQYGSPYHLAKLVRPDLHDREVLQESSFDPFGRLFDHTKRFKPRGPGAKKPVMAISSPYLRDNDEVEALVQEYASRYELSYRINNHRDRIYTADGTIPITFWRGDLHDFVG